MVVNEFTKSFLVYDIWYIKHVFVWRYFRESCFWWDWKFSEYCNIKYFIGRFKIEYIGGVCQIQGYIKKVSNSEVILDSYIEIVLMKKFLEIAFNFLSLQNTDVFENYQTIISISYLYTSFFCYTFVKMNQVKNCLQFCILLLCLMCLLLHRINCSPFWSNFVSC